MPRVSFDTVAQARGILDALCRTARPFAQDPLAPGDACGAAVPAGKNELVVSVEWGRGGRERGRARRRSGGEYLALGSIVDTLLVNLPS